ncbi:MAG: nuclear transport factor 2 family protein [Solirubrobacterales bacterium]|nr:nuclear transport factor 2 family protein [Solirubrobacterales bacterium]
MLERLAQAFAAQDAAGVAATLADDVTLRVAVHDEPFEGAAGARQILETVLDGVLHDIAVGETIGGGDAAAVLFTAQVASRPGAADGLLVVRPADGGPIADLTVFLRPLGALQELAAEMGRRLGTPKPTGMP